MENTFSMVAKTFQGLEDVLRDEPVLPYSPEDSKTD